MPPKSQESYLFDILEAARAIQEFLGVTDRTVFEADRMRIRAVEREFEILGEAAKRVDESVRLEFPAIDFRAAAGMRDVISHDYDNVRLDILWKVSHETLPILVELLERHLAKELRDITTDREPAERDGSAG